MQHANDPQRRIREELIGTSRPDFPSDLPQRLRSHLEGELATILSEFAGEDDLFVSKRDLGAVHACEAHWWALQTDAPFEWTPQTAKGAISHKAIELAIASGFHIPPLTLVDGAIDRIKANGGRGSPREWLEEADELDVAELRAEANALTTSFLECFPAMEPEWRAVTERRVYADLCGGRVTLFAKPDLTLSPFGPADRPLITDLKSGRAYANHLEDMRFYALVFTLRGGIPPYRIATYYLDGATFHAEDVDEGVLFAACRRVVDGVRAMVAIQYGHREPTITANPACRWCPANVDCPGAREWEEGNQK